MDINHEQDHILFGDKQIKIPAGVSQISVFREEELKDHLSLDQTEEEIMRIFMKPGKEWSEEEIDKAVNYFMKEYLDKLIRFAYVRIKGALDDEEKALEEAKDVVFKKLYDVFYKYRHTYDPKKYKKYPVKNPFVNWVYTIIAREANKQRKRLEKAQKRIQKEKENAQKRVNREISNHSPDINWKDVEPFLYEVSEKSQEALSLILEERKSYKEASKESSWPCKNDTMKLRFWRARNFLYEFLQFFDKLSFDLKQAYILTKVKRNTIPNAARIAKITVEEMRERYHRVLQKLKEFQNS